MRFYDHCGYKIKITYDNNGMVYWGAIYSPGGTFLTVTTNHKKEGDAEKEAEEICGNLARHSRQCDDCEEI